MGFSWQRWLVLSCVFFLIALCPAAVAAQQAFSRQDNQKEGLIPVTSAENFSGCAGDPIPIVNNEYEQQVVELTNAARAGQGLPPLKRVEGLNESARYHAADMNIDDYFSHDTYDRRDGNLREICNTWDRIEHFYSGWLALAENIAAGQRSPEMAMDGWMNSPDHYHNIMGENYWEIGSGYYNGEATYRYYWVQNFGKKEGRYPLIIAGEAARVEQRNVEVYIYGDWQEMRLNLNNGEWTEWQPFLKRFNWDLPKAPGDYSLTAQLRGPNGATITSDSISLEDAATPVSALFHSLWLGQ